MKNEIRDLRGLLDELEFARRALADTLASPEVAGLLVLHGDVEAVAASLRSLRSGLTQDLSAVTAVVEQLRKEVRYEQSEVEKWRLGTIFVLAALSASAGALACWITLINI